MSREVHRAHIRHGLADRRHLFEGEGAEVDRAHRRRGERGGDLGIDGGLDFHRHANCAPTVGSTYSSMRLMRPSSVVVTIRQLCISKGLPFERTLPRVAYAS